jgi:hypothetical protein
MTRATSPIKRQRATKNEVEDRRAALFDIIEKMNPMTVRQVFYQASSRATPRRRIRSVWPGPRSTR